MTPTEFTPYAGLIGGLLIGLSAVVLMGSAGRIAGASGITNGLLTLRFDQNFIWRAIFILGLLAGTLAISPWAANANTLSFPAGTPVTIISGLLVGFGTILGNGCTSGHGICGISRFSLRSLVSTAIFMAVAIATVFVTQKFLGG